MISVVVCAKDEAEGIADCLWALLLCRDVGEIIVVVGTSTDGTRQVVREMLWEHARPLGVRYTIIASDAGSLAADRQKGADQARGMFVAYIDADHRVGAGTLGRLLRELHCAAADVLQGRVRIVPRSFWNRAESSFLRMTMVPGEHDMVGVAPTIFRRPVLCEVKFADGMTIDDTDLMYRLHRDTPYRTFTGEEIVDCEHAPRLRDYWSKWSWYGRGDKQFMAAHPERAASMRFHLLVRYPIVYPARALLRGRLRAAPYAFLQGVARAMAAFS